MGFLRRAHIVAVEVALWLASPLIANGIEAMFGGEPDDCR